MPLLPQICASLQKRVSRLRQVGGPPTSETEHRILCEFDLGLQAIADMQAVGAAADDDV